MPRKSGLRTGIIYKFLDSYLFALSGGDFMMAGTHLKSLADFLKIKIAHVPLNDCMSPTESQLWLKYCLQSEPKVLQAIDVNLLKFSEKANPFHMYGRGRPGSDEDEEDG